MAETARVLAELERSLRERPSDPDLWLELARMSERTGTWPPFLDRGLHLTVLLRLAAERPEERVVAGMALHLLGLEEAPCPEAEVPALVASEALDYPGDGEVAVLRSRGLPVRVRRVRDGAPMVYVPGSRFVSRRAAGGLLDDAPQNREVAEHYLDVREVTVEQYVRFLAATQHRAPRHWVRQAARPSRPVVHVDWLDVAAFAAWAGGRPPSESEWELAGGMGAGLRFPWGDAEPESERANYQMGGRRDPRAWDEHLEDADARPLSRSLSGAEDLLGNVCELCLVDGAPFPPEDGGADRGPRALAQAPGRDAGCVARGASWRHPESDLHITARRPVGSRFAENTLGFRLVVPLLALLLALIRIPPATAGDLPAHAAARFGDASMAHRDNVIAVAWNPDGSLLASGASDRKIHLWDADSRSRLRTLEGPMEFVLSLEFSQDGSRLAASSTDGSVQVHDTESGDRVYRDVSHDRDVVRALFTPDDLAVVSAGGDGSVRVHDLGAGAVRAEIPVQISGPRTPGTTGITDLALTADGGTAAVTTRDGWLALVDLPTRALVQARRISQNGLLDVAFAPGDRTVLVATTEKEVQFLDVPELRTVSTLHLGELNGLHLELSPGARRLLVSGTDGAAHLYALESGKLLRSYREAGHWAQKLRFSPDGKTLAGGLGMRVSLWDAATGVVLGGAGGHRAALTGLGISADGRVASIGQDGSAALWSLADGKEIARRRDALNWYDGQFRVLHAALPVHRGLLYLDRSPQVLRWGLGDPTIPTMIRNIEYPSCLATTPTGKPLIVGNYRGAAVVFDDESRRSIRLSGGNRPLHAVALSWDGKLAATGGEDTRVRIHDAASGRLLHTLGGHVGPVVDLGFSPDGARLASGGRDSTVFLWDTATGAELLRTGGDTLDLTGTVALAPDGDGVALGGTDGSVRLLSLQAGAEVARLEGHRGDVFPVRYSPDGRYLVSGAKDGTAIVWDLSSLGGPD